MKQKPGTLYLSLLGAAFDLIAVIWLTAGSLQTRFDVVKEQNFSFFFPLANPQPHQHGLHHRLAGVCVYIKCQGKGLWPMFFFGFAALIVLTPMYGLGLSRRVCRLVTGGFVSGCILRTQRRTGAHQRGDPHPGYRVRDGLPLLRNIPRQ